MDDSSGVNGHNQVRGAESLHARKKADGAERQDCAPALAACRRSDFWDTGRDKLLFIILFYLIYYY